MTGLLLAERAPADGHILVLGAGGGSELKAMADAHPGWRFTGADPAAPMLDLAAKIMGPDAANAELIEGTITDATTRPFTGATCLLTPPLPYPAYTLRTAAQHPPPHNPVPAEPPPPSSPP